MMEALILYFVLFFPGVYVTGLSGRETVPFSLLGELGRTVTYTLPSLALLWYLITDKKGFSSFSEIKPHKADFYSLAPGFPGLILIGVLISLLARLLSPYTGIDMPPGVKGPENLQGYIVIVFSCLFTGYLEESYFRYYLLTRLELVIPNTLIQIMLSSFLFALCHVYEGPWGIINAALAGVFLSVLYLRFRAIHGIAWAHGAYNIFVYAMGNFSV